MGKASRNRAIFMIGLNLKLRANGVGAMIHDAKPMRFFGFAGGERHAVVFYREDKPSENSDRQE